jgi:hypothetical protein
MTTQHPSLPRWDPDSAAQDGRLWVFMGRHGAGKSTALKYAVAWPNQYCRDWVGFSPTASGSRVLKQLLPRAYIYERSPTAKDLQDIVDKQVAETQLADADPRYAPRRIGVIIDDAGYDKRLLRSTEEFVKIIMNQRQWGVHIFLTIQYIRQIPPEIHEQVDYLFIIDSKDARNRKALYDSFFKDNMDVPRGIRYTQREMERLSYWCDYYLRGKGTAIVIDKEGPTYISRFEWPAEFHEFVLGDREYQSSARDIDPRDDVEASFGGESLRERIRRIKETRFM